MSEAVKTFFGDEEFPVDWEDGQKDLLWVHDDLHIPNPISPMYADIGGWWLKCDYMFRRFGTPFASDWISKVINGYVYTAAIPAQKGLSAEATEYGARYTPRVPVDENYVNDIGGYLGWTLPHYAENFLEWWRDRLVPEMSRNFERFDTYDYSSASLVELAVLLEDAIDMHDRHWSIHWVLNFAQFSSTTNLNTVIAETKDEGDHSALMGRLQSSTENRNWDSIEELWKLKEAVKNDGGAVSEAFSSGATGGDVIKALDAGQVRRVDERAVDPVGHLRGARDLSRGKRALDLALDVADRGGVARADEGDVHCVGKTGERLELSERQVDVGGLTPERWLDEPHDPELRAVQVQRRPDSKVVAARVGCRQERLSTACRGEVAAAGHLRGRDEREGRPALVDAADRVWLRLDVRLRRVEHLAQSLSRRRDRCPEAPEALGQAGLERASADAQGTRPWGADAPAPSRAGGRGLRNPLRVRGPRLLQASLDLDQLCGGRRLHPPRDVEPLSAGLDTGDDLRDDALLVLGQQD